MMTLTTRSAAVPLKQVKLTDPYWSNYIELVREVVIPYQYEALHDRIPGIEPSHGVSNFRIAAGRDEGEYGGMVFQDSDVAKWLEAAAYSLATHRDPKLEEQVDELIDLVADAQQPDGYLNTYFTVNEPEKRWTNLTDCHELYCAGHMIEAGVAHYRATGKRKLLDVVCRLADHIDSVFGPEDGKIHGFDGHQEIELALVKLYEVTQEPRYLSLSQYFIDERGTEPHFFLQEWEQRGKKSFYRSVLHAPHLAYHQSHLPVREQTEAVGHSVRAVYMYTAMADLAARTKDPALLEACDALWRNMVHKQMYITGGIGSTHHGEAFTTDYDLPNDTVYSETCASIGLIFFAQRMLQLAPKSEYADVMERALFNTVISSMAQDGRHFFYVNPLEVWPAACRHNPGKAHVKPVRPGWFACACCPPNVARLLSSLGEYVYTMNDDTLYAHLYIGGEAEVRFGDVPVKVMQNSALPWDGDVTFTLQPEQAVEWTVALRIPEWSRGKAGLRVNGQEMNVEDITQDGYACVKRVWAPGDTVELAFSMEIHQVRANPNIRGNAGKAAIQRGPLVYCLESVDHGVPVSSLSLAGDPKLRSRFDPNLLGGAVVIEGAGWLEESDDWGDEQLYRSSPKKMLPASLKAIPYYLWGHRGENEMAVWVREQPRTV
ncbi:glycoside hydrolase family 127 protein [Paenibacillus sp. CR_12]|uniref:glycoside hydrolase family 127 protein n=1 Tax=Paenibacillus sp. CR_12 TaxID=3055793 RepID=UPI0035BFE2B7